jgi:hypothetical protein
VIALITFPIAGALAWLHYATLGAKVGMGLTVWTAWFAAVLIASGVDAARTNDRQIILAWCVMFAGWVASMMAWKLSSNPLVDLTIKNLIIMAALLIIAFRPETALPVLLHGVVILAAYLASVGVIPSANQRPRQFLAWSYPDIAAGLQHASLIILGGYGACRGRLLGWRDHGGSVASVNSGALSRKAKG